MTETGVIAMYIRERERWKLERGGKRAFMVVRGRGRRREVAVAKKNHIQMHKHFPKETHFNTCTGWWRAVEIYPENTDKAQDESVWLHGIVWMSSHVKGKKERNFPFLFSKILLIKGNKTNKSLFCIIILITTVVNISCLVVDFPSSVKRSCLCTEYNLGQLRLFSCWKTEFTT